MEIIQRQHGINYIRNLILDNDMTILTNYKLGDDEIEYKMYKDIIYMIRTIRIYINNNPEDYNSEQNTSNIHNNFTLKSRIFRKTIKKSRDNVQSIYDKFDIEFYSSLLYDILVSHEMAKIVELNNLCKKINSNLNELINSKKLTTGNFDKLQYRLIVEQMTFILNSFYTIIPEGYPNAKIKEFVDRINKGLKDTISIYSFALTPDGKILTTKGDDIGKKYLGKMKYRDIFSDQSIVDILKPIIEEKNTAATVDEILSNLYDDMLKYGAICSSHMYNIPNFSAEEENHLDYIKTQSNKFFNLRTDMLNKTKELVKYPHLELTKIIGNPALFKKFKDNLQSATEEDFNKFVSSYYITFIFDVLPSYYSIDEYTSNRETEKNIKELYEKKENQLKEALEKLKQEKMAVLKGGSSTEFDILDGKYMSFPHKGSKNPHNSLEERNLFFEILKKLPKNKLIDELIKKIVKENLIVEQCIENDIKFKALYVPLDESKRIDYNSGELNNKVVIGMTLYTFIKTLNLLQNTIFQKFKKFIRTIFTYGNIVLNQSIEFRNSNEGRYLLDGTINEGTIQELVTDTKNSLIRGILRCRQDDWQERVNYRYKISHKDKIVVIKYTNMNIDNDRFTNIVETQKNRLDGTIAYPQINSGVELTRIFTGYNTLTSEAKQLKIEEYYKYLDSLDEFQRNRYNSNDTNIDDTEFKKYMDSKEYYKFGPFDYVYGVHVDNNQTIAKDMLKDFNIYLLNRESPCIISLGQSGSGKTSAVVSYKPSGGTPQPGIAFTLLSEYAETYKDDPDNKITTCSFKFFNICKGDQTTEELEQYKSLGNIATWDTSGDFYDVSVEPEQSGFNYNPSQKNFINSRNQDIGTIIVNYIEDESIRPVATTVNNSVSSRSHAIIAIKILYGNGDSSYMFICDLAGVENVFDPKDEGTLRKLLVKYVDYYKSKEPIITPTDRIPYSGISNVHKSTFDGTQADNGSSKFEFKELFTPALFNITKNFPPRIMLPRSIAIKLLLHRKQSFNDTLNTDKVKFQKSLRKRTHSGTIENHDSAQDKAELSVAKFTQPICVVEQGCFILAVQINYIIGGDFSIIDPGDNNFIEGTIFRGRDFTDNTGLRTRYIKEQYEIPQPDPNPPLTNKEILLTIFKNDTTQELNTYLTVAEMCTELKHALHRYFIIGKNFTEERYCIYVNNSISKSFTTDTSQYFFNYICKDTEGKEIYFNIQLADKAGIIYSKNENILSTLMFGPDEITEVESMFNKCLGWIYPTSDSELPIGDDDTISGNHITNVTSGYFLWYIRSAAGLSVPPQLFPVTHGDPKFKPSITPILVSKNRGYKSGVKYKNYKGDEVSFDDVTRMVRGYTSTVQIRRKIPGSVPPTTTTVKTESFYMKLTHPSYDYNKLSIHYFLLMYLGYEGGYPLKQYKYINGSTSIDKKLFLPEPLYNDFIDSTSIYSNIRTSLSTDLINGIGELLSVSNPKMKYEIYNLFRAFLVLIFNKHIEYMNIRPEEKNIWEHVCNLFEANKIADLKTYITTLGKGNCLIVAGVDDGFYEIVKLFEPISETTTNPKLDIFIMYISEYSEMIMRMVKIVNDTRSTKTEPISLKHITKNIRIFSSGSYDIVSYNCKYSVYEGYAINKALEELQRDLSFMAKSSSGEFIELYTSSSFTKECLKLNDTSESKLDEEELISPSFGMILRVIASCILNKDFNKASDYLENITSNDVADTIKRKLKLFTFTVLHYSTLSKGISVNNPPPIPFINTRDINLSIYKFNLGYKYYDYDKSINNIKETIYDDRIINVFKEVIFAIKKIISSENYTDKLGKELTIYSMAESFNTHDPPNNFTSKIQAYIYIRDNDASDIIAAMGKNIDQMKAYVDLIQTEIINPIDKIIGITLIGTMVTTQSLINAGSNFICSGSYTDILQEDEFA